MLFVSGLNCIRRTLEDCSSDLPSHLPLGDQGRLEFQSR